jgi:hypothetical protein
MQQQLLTLGFTVTRKSQAREGAALQALELAEEVLHLLGVGGVGCLDGALCRLGGGSRGLLLRRQRRAQLRRLGPRRPQRLGVHRRILVEEIRGGRK